MEYKDELKDFIKGLRRMADWLEKNGETLHPVIYPITVNILGSSLHELSAKAKSFGRSKKLYQDQFFVLRKSFGKNVNVDLFSLREVVCERVLVSSEVIPAHTIPATHEIQVPERVEEKYEWRCPDSILKGGQHE